MNQMPIIKNARGQVLFHLKNGQIYNFHDQHIAEVSGSHLKNLMGQDLARVESGRVFGLNDVPLLEVDGNEVRNLHGQRLATVEAGTPEEKGVLAAALLLFA